MENRKSLFTTLLIVGILVILAIIIFSSKIGGLQGSGTIELTIEKSGSSVFFENRMRAVTQTENELFTANRLKNGTHSLIVAKDGFWPWTKDIKIKNGEKISVKSWSLPKVTDMETLATNDPEYSQKFGEIRKKETPTKDSKIRKGNISVWSENNMIIASWEGEESEIPYYFCEDECNSEITVFKGTSNIIDLDFFKDNSDILIFSNEEGLFVIEVNGLGTQNFQPIIRVNSPEFITEDGKTIYILENQEITKINL